MTSPLTPSIEPLLQQAAHLLGVNTESDYAQNTSWQHFIHSWLSTTVDQWLTKNADLDQAAKESLALMPVLISKMADAHAYPWDPQPHPIRSLVEIAAGALRGFDAFSGKTAGPLCGHISAALSSCLQAPENASHAIENLALQLKQFNQELHQKEQALIQKEREQWRLAAARVGVDQCLDVRLSELSLPDFVIEFIENDFRKLLQVIHVQHGTQSDAWQTLQQTLDALIWTFTDSNSDTLRQEYRQRVSEPQAHLKAQFAQTHHNKRAVDDFFTQWDEHIFCVMSGSAPAINLAHHEHSTHEQRDWIFAEDAFLKARAIRVGDWVQIFQHEHWVRAKLIEKDLHQGNYLFANLAGLKISAVTTEELAEQFAQEQARLIDNRPVFIQLQSHLIDRLEDEIAQLSIEKAHAIERTKAAKEAAIQAEITQAKARLEQERERRKQSVMEKAQEQARQRLKQEYTQNLQKLKPGAWIEIKQHEQWLRAQLAIILNRSGEFVFVDTQGKKLLQTMLPDLVQRMSEQQLKILDYGKVLDDALAQLVQDRRQHLNNWQ